MIYQTTKLEQHIPSSVGVQTLCYHPLNGFITIVRALLARNPKVPSMTNSNLSTLDIRAGISEARRSIDIGSQLITEYANLMNLNNLTRLDRNVARAYIDSQIASRNPGSNLGSVTTVLATETNRNQLFLNQVNAITNDVRNARDVWGGGYTNWSFASGLTSSTGLLAEMGALTLTGGVTPSSYQPFVNTTNDSNVFTWLTKFMVTCEFMAYKGLAQQQGFDLEKYLDKHLGSLSNASYQRAGLEVQFELALLRPWLDLAMNPNVQRTLHPVLGSLFPLFMKDVELLVSKPMSKLAWSMVGGHERMQFASHMRDVHMMPCAAQPTLAAYFSESILTRISEAAGLWYNGTFSKVYDALSAAGGWTKESPWVPLTRVASLDMMKPIYTNHSKLSVPQGIGLDLRALPYSFLRSSSEDTAAYLAMAGQPGFNQKYNLDVLLQRRPSTLPLIVTNQNPTYTDLRGSMAKNLSAVRPFSEYTGDGEEFGLDYPSPHDGGSKRLFSKILRLNVTILANEFNYPQSEVEAVIRAGGLKHLFPTDDPAVPAKDANGLPIQVFCSELTYNMVNGASIAINDARPIRVSNYETAGMQTVGGPRFVDCSSAPVFEGTFGYNTDSPEMNSSVESYVDDGLAIVLALSSVENNRAVTAVERLMSTVPTQTDQQVIDDSANVMATSAVDSNVEM
uniref:Uncharacterized protein n=1 Tax=viral metagenome TaxID=1070528 RepID=A0A2V0RMI5_9ZZZZ